MVEPTPLDPFREVAAFAEKVAEVCRCRLCERPRDPVPIEHIVAQTLEPRSRVEAALAWLRREGRLRTGRYAMRSRPHVAVEAVDRIDDVATH